jgi:mono/diheme cytochrome c family protein
MASAAEPVTPELTPKLDRLLRQEMQAIDRAMGTIFSAIVTGDHTTVADKAERIHASFILKQNLTPADKRDLKAAVPKAFLKLDQAFHRDAAELAEAARAGDARRELAVFQKMGRACVTCHSRYVTDRFPGLE